MSAATKNLSKNLDTIFYPQSLAVIGANNVAGTVPNDILVNILRDNYRGAVYPVSPREQSIAGVKAYKYAIDIEDPIDLGILVFQSSVCHLALEQMGQKGIKAAIIVTAGFREVGGKGLEREAQIKEIAAKHGISFIGPNCLGVINTDPICHLNASFARKMPEEGNIAFLSQSGALCTAVLDYAQAKHIGFSKFVSFGNKADITEIDLMRYLKDDPKTKVILLYLEEITDGPGLMAMAREIISEAGKPVLMIKSGRTTEGAQAAASHTGSLAGGDDVCDAALRQAGIIRCGNIEEMFNTAIALAYQPLPKGDRVAIVTNAGGPGVLATDAAVSEGLAIARFSEDTTKVLKKSLPNTANIKNPVDVIGDARADRYNIALSQALKDDNVDGVFVILTPQSMTDIENIAQEICMVAGQSEKPLYASFMGEADVAVGIDLLQRRSIPHYQLPESMCRSFAKAHYFKELFERNADPPVVPKGLNKAAALKVLDEASAAGNSHLPEAEALKVLSAYGLPVLDHAVAGSKQEAVELSRKIGFPLAMKIVSKEVIHKSDAGGVRVGISAEKEVGKAYDSILKNVKAKQPEAKVDGILIEKMAPDGEEVILGIKRDPSFGAVLMFGLGGIFVEVLKDVAFRVAPLGPDEIDRMIHEIRAYPLLAGARGRTPKDVSSLAEALARLSQLALDCPQIEELDINPLIVSDEGQGCHVADARIMI